MTYITLKHLYEALKMNKISGKRVTREDRNRIRRLMTFAFNEFNDIACVHLIANFLNIIHFLYYE